MKHIREFENIEHSEVKNLGDVIKYFNEIFEYKGVHFMKVEDSIRSGYYLVTSSNNNVNGDISVQFYEEFKSTYLGEKFEDFKDAIDKFDVQVQGNKFNL